MSRRGEGGETRISLLPYRSTWNPDNGPICRGCFYREMAPVATRVTLSQSACIWAQADIQSPFLLLFFSVFTLCEWTTKRLPAGEQAKPGPHVPGIPRFSSLMLDCYPPTRSRVDKSPWCFYSPPPTPPTPPAPPPAPTPRPTLAILAGLKKVESAEKTQGLVSPRLQQSWKLMEGV